MTKLNSMIGLRLAVMLKGIQLPSLASVRGPDPR